MKFCFHVVLLVSFSASLSKNLLVRMYLPLASHLLREMT